MEGPHCNSGLFRGIMSLSKVGSSLSLSSAPNTRPAYGNYVLSVRSVELRPPAFRQEQVSSLTCMAPWQLSWDQLHCRFLPGSPWHHPCSSSCISESYVLCHSSFYLPPESTPNLRAFLPCSYSSILTACLQSKSEITDPLLASLLLLWLPYFFLLLVEV